MMELIIYSIMVLEVLSLYIGIEVQKDKWSDILSMETASKEYHKIVGYSVVAIIFCMTGFMAVCMITHDVMLAVGVFAVIFFGWLNVVLGMIAKDYKSMKGVL